MLHCAGLFITKRDYPKYSTREFPNSTPESKTIVLLRLCLQGGQSPGCTILSSGKVAFSEPLFQGNQ